MHPGQGWRLAQGWGGPGGRSGLTRLPVTVGSLCRRAKLLLKKKRYREQLLDKTENQITSLETMVGRAGRAGGSESPPRTFLDL